MVSAASRDSKAYGSAHYQPLRIQGYNHRHLPLADIWRFSSVAPVLITIGVAHVILKMAYGFETAELEELTN